MSRFQRSGRFKGSAVEGNAMSSVVWINDPAEERYYLEWAGSLIPHIGPEGFFDTPCRVAAVKSIGGGLRAVVIFHDWQPEAKTMQVSAASITPHWASPEALCELLSYAFDTNHARKLWMAIPHTSENVVKFNKHLGFRQEAILRYHFSENQHAVILSMLEDEYRRGRWCGDGSREFSETVHNDFEHKE